MTKDIIAHVAHDDGNNFVEEDAVALTDGKDMRGTDVKAFF